MKTVSELIHKLQELEVKIGDWDNYPEREIETMNIEYEKLIMELEKVPEFVRHTQQEISGWEQATAQEIEYAIYS